MKQVNRRRTVKRRGGLSRLFGGGGNRRVHRSQATGPMPAAHAETDDSAAEDKPRRSKRATAERPARASKDPAAPGRLRGAGKAIKRIALRATTVAAVLAVGLGAAFAGNCGYKHLQRSTHFNVAQISFSGLDRIDASELRERVGSVYGRAIFNVDSDEVARALEGHPWVRKADVQQDLPRTLRVSIVEQRARAAVLLGDVYLVNDEGEVFKQATGDEASGLVMVTGLERGAYLERPQDTQRAIMRALERIYAYRRQERPPLSEVHLGQGGETSMFLRRGGIALRFGNRFGEAGLRRFDEVWAALGTESNNVRAVYLDHERRPDRVIVRMSSN